MNDPIQKMTYQGGYYHVFNRGNRKQDIFLEDKDYVFYLEKLRQYKEKYDIVVLCYCLMPNHLHLLLRQNSDMPIYKFMHAFHTSYSSYFNKKYDKVGHLFQGRFKQKHVDKDEYLLFLSSYIHFNPVVDGKADILKDYQWSSYLDYIGLRDGTLCEKDLVIREMSSKEYEKITEQELKDKLLRDEIFNNMPKDVVL